MDGQVDFMHKKIQFQDNFGRMIRPDSCKGNVLEIQGAAYCYCLFNGFFAWFSVTFCREILDQSAERSHTISESATGKSTSRSIVNFQ